MNQEVFEKLQYTTIKTLLRDYCVSDEGKKRIEHLQPSSKLKVVQNRLDETTECRRLLDMTGSLPLQGMTYIGEIFDKLEKDIVLNEEQLASIANFLRGCRKMLIYMKARQGDAPLLYGYSLGLQAFQSDRKSVV